MYVLKGLGDEEAAVDKLKRYGLYAGIGFIVMYVLAGITYKPKI